MTHELPEDLVALTADFDRLEARAAALLDGLTPAQLNWQPQGGTAWSIGQCVDHLVRSNESYLGPMEDAIREAVLDSEPMRHDPIRPRGFWRWFIQQLEPPPKRRLPAPKKILPAAVHETGALLARLRATHQTAKDLLQDAAVLDLNRLKFRNPLVKILRVPVGSALHILTAHERRHLLQAEKVRVLPGFP